MSAKLWTANGEQNGMGSPGDVLFNNVSDERAAYLRGGYFGQKMPKNLGGKYPMYPAGPVDFRNHRHSASFILNNIGSARMAAQSYNMAVRVPINGIKTTIY